MLTLATSKHDGVIYDDTLFGLIAQDVETQGFSIRHGALPDSIANGLVSLNRLNLRPYQGSVVI